MQKNDKSYAFLLLHSSKNRIFIKRIEISKRWLHFTPVSIFLVLGITAFAFGIKGIINNPSLLETATNASALTKISAQPATTTEIVEQQQPLADEFAINSGGPAEDNEADGEDKELDGQLKAIEVRSDAASLPTMWAHLGKINNEFGFRRNPFGGRAYEFHPGMDIDGERGDLVVAPANGTVISAGYKGGYGNMVEVDHGNGLVTRYGHMSKLEVEAGDTITRGQLLGYIGSTGRSTGPHLHFELRLNDRPINPRHFLPPEPTDLASLEK